MQNWAISLEEVEESRFSSENHEFVRVRSFMKAPGTGIGAATLQKFANITPQYPGIRSPLPQSVADEWLCELTPLLDASFGTARQGWQMQAWFSLVTSPPEDLIPMQRFPHVDGTDPRQLAMMLYLHHTDHGGTGFFRHRSTGLSSLTDDSFSRYRTALEEDVRRSGMPPAAYVTDGSPYFERIHASEGAFNEAIFYRGNVLHSGLIDAGTRLSPDPTRGRLTINAFFRPKG